MAALSLMIFVVCNTSSVPGNAAVETMMVSFFALFFHAFPGILLLILFQLFASATSLFPVTAYPDFPFSDAPGKFVFSYVHHIFLPLLASFLGGVGGTMRTIRSTMLDQMGLPYIMAIRVFQKQRNIIQVEFRLRRVLALQVIHQQVLQEVLKVAVHLQTKRISGFYMRDKCRGECDDW